jgi:hypothetical protein
MHKFSLNFVEKIVKDTQISIGAADFGIGNIND